LRVSRKYAHIETYNCIAYYLQDTTKETLIEYAATLAATWCPSACVVWSPEETIWPVKTDKGAQKVDAADK